MGLSRWDSSERATPGSVDQAFRQRRRRVNAYSAEVEDEVLVIPEMQDVAAVSGQHRSVDEAW